MGAEEDTAAAPTHAPVAARSTAGHIARIVGITLAAALVGVVVFVAAAAGAVAWALHSEPGTAWVLARVPGLAVTAPKGTLLGNFEAQRIVAALAGKDASVTLTGFAWHGLRIEREPGTLWFRLIVDELRAARVDVQLAADASQQPLTPPSSLRLLFEADVRSLQVGELHLSALDEHPLREMKGRIHLGADRGREHRVDGLSLVWDKLRASGSARIDSAAPLALQATIEAAQAAAPSASAALPAWSAQATLDGPLAAPQLKATLRAQPSDQRAAQSLDLSAALRPFSAWPIDTLRARTSALDLAAFSSAAPSTALSGEATARRIAAGQPVNLIVALANALPGRWNEGRVPVRSVKVELTGRPEHPDELDLNSLVADLGNASQTAGRVSAQGRWSARRWTLNATLAALQPAQLDARAPVMQLDGPLTLVGGDFGSAAASTVDVTADLAGTVRDRGVARQVRLRLGATVHPQRIEVRDAQATAGGAHASLSGLATRTDNTAPWRVNAKAALVDFDPGVWWPGAEDSPWRSAPSRLNANGSADLTLPADLARRGAGDLLAAIRGQAGITLAPSVLVGVPLSGDASLHGDGTRALPVVRLDADGNHLRVHGNVLTAGSGVNDQWEVVLDGPSLIHLAPVFKLLMPPGSDTTLAGSVQAKATLQGRWPALTTQGSIDASALHVGTAAMQHLTGSWKLGSSLSAPMEAAFTLAQLAVGPKDAQRPVLESADLKLEGTGRAHQLTLHAASKAVPPAWTDTLQPGASPADLAPAKARTVAVLQAKGGLVEGPAAPLAGWRGSLQQLEVRTLASGAPLLRTKDVGIEVGWAGGPAHAIVQPGRAEVLAGALRWSRITWNAPATPGGAAQIDAEADLEPLRVAPLLARIQPDFGWGGDLTISGHLVLHSAPTFSADIVLERSSGDLTVVDELHTQPLGLTDLRLALKADNGVWNFTQALAGKAVGVGAGLVVVRTSPLATWPTADAPLEGLIELSVADLGNWGAWLPPGWRVQGALHTSATIGGHFGGPEYIGAVQATQVGIRNFTQGVNVSDGDIALSLRGNTAHIDRFTVKGGSGTVKLSGDADLGDAPKAVLKLEADKFQLLGRVDRRIVASGHAQLTLDAKNLALEGSFGVDEGLVDFTRSDAPSLGSDVEVVRRSAQPAADAPPAPVPTASSRKVALELTVALGEKLRLRGRGLDTGLRGELRITAPGGRMAVNGSVRAADGTYAAYGQKLVIDRGDVTFNGLVDNPRLDIEATRPNLDLRVGVAITGSAQNPRIRLFSEPEVSEIDKLSWLVLGRASDSVGRNDTALLQSAVLALLAGESTGPTDQLLQAIGLDSFSVGQSSGEVRDTVVSVGKQLSRDWYVGYEHGLNATGGSFQLIYRIARRFTLRVQSGADNSVDLIWTWRWQ